MKRLLVATTISLAACDGENTGGTAAQIATSDAILARLQEPFAPAPGTRFAKDGELSPVVGGHSGVHTREAYRTTGFSLALEAIELPMLAARAREIDPAFKALSDLRTWSDLVAGLKKGTGALDGLIQALALQYADRFSGLGLKKERHMYWLTEEAAGGAVDLKDGTGANVIRIETWVTVLEARAFISLTYFAHSGDRTYRVSGSSAPWGTRR